MTQNMDNETHDRLLKAIASNRKSCNKHKIKNPVAKISMQLKTGLNFNG
jgi:hypothetical protein